MAAPVTFYAEQAEICGKAAQSAALPNEREKFLRAQASWEALANKTAKVQAERAARLVKPDDDEYQPGEQPLTR